MHVPIGVSGVQAVPNTLHSHGLITPFSTSPHWHAFGSATRTSGHVVAQLGVEGGELGAQLERALRDEAEASPLEVRAELEHLGQDLERPRVALVADHPRVLVLDLAAALADLGEQHGDRLEDVERLEAGGHERLAVLRRARTGRGGCPRPSTRARARGSRRGAGRATRGSP